MKFPIFSLIFTVFLFWLTTQISASYEEYLSYIFILTIGIIHGSNDISLIKVVRKREKLSIKYLLFYIGLVFLNTIAFLVSPILALVLFVLISCYHFGEQHFHHQIKELNILSRLLFLSYGILIFGLLFYFNSDHTSLIINDLIAYALTEHQFLWFLGAGIISTLLFYGLNFKNFKTGSNHFQEVFLILLFAILFKLAALLWAFAIYFVVWHSIPSLRDQIKVLYGESTKIGIMQYIKSSLMYWLISIFGLTLLYFATRYYQVNFVTVFFAFLAAITVPHVIVMYFLNKN